MTRKIAGLIDNGHFEAISNGRMPLFLLREGSTFRTQSEITTGNETFSPPSSSEYPYPPYDFSEEIFGLTLNNPVPSNSDLFDRVRAELESFLDVEPIYLDLFASCILLTYQQDKLNSVPYLYLVGDNATGKTTLPNLFGILAYRPLQGVSIPVADIFGYLADSEQMIPTLLEDETQGIEDENDKVKVYKAGYKKGAKVPRTTLLREGRRISYYNTFCFKVVTAEAESPIKGFMERFIVIHAYRGNPRKDWVDINHDDSHRFSKLRNDLLQYRLATRGEELPDDLVVPVKGRLKEIWKPVLQAVKGLPVEARLREFILLQEKERVGSQQASLEGQLVKVIHQLAGGSPSTDSTLALSNATIWDALHVELDASTSDYRPNEMDTPELGRITKMRISYILRDKFNAHGTGIGTGNSRERGYIFERQRIERCGHRMDTAQVGQAGRVGRVRDSFQRMKVRLVRLRKTVRRTRSRLKTMLLKASQSSQ